MEDCGGMAERLKAAVLKTAEARASRGCRSLPLPQIPPRLLLRESAHRSPPPVCARGWAKAGMIDDQRIGNPYRQGPKPGGGPRRRKGRAREQRGGREHAP